MLEYFSVDSLAVFTAFSLYLVSARLSSPLLL